jgi:hypothetical protein
MLAADHAPTLVLHLAGARRPSALVPFQAAALFYGLSLAAVLPPAAWLPPAHEALPTIHPTAHTAIDVVALATSLLEPVTELGRGRIALGEVDRRLGGLSLALDLFRVGDGRGSLIPIGVIRRDSPAGQTGGATLADLWLLARDTIPRYGRVWGCWPGPGSDAVLVRYDSATAQIAWLGADYVATVSVTSLDGDDRQTSETVHTVARLLAGHLESEAHGD